MEVMGLLLGYPNPDAPHSLVETDALPLLVEEFETLGVADDEDAMNHMIKLGESVERSRREHFIGWHHSHPFDVEIHSHCCMSQKDMSSQILWQRGEEPYGNPFLAIVFDTLRSLEKKLSELKSFRVHLPEWESNVTNECPDGSVMPNEIACLEKWGVCWSRCYEPDVEHFISERARSVMGVLIKNYLWMTTLSTTKLL